MQPPPQLRDKFLNRIVCGDALETLRTLPDESVQCCITSPPYWGLRDYGVDGQLGLEKTPEEYIAKMVEVFREVRRVLRRDGTLWLNIGDSYAAGGRGQGECKQRTNKGSNLPPLKPPTGYKPKDLVGIPWMLAFALRADGWYLRSDIIWSKPNPMPESVTDRPTKAHEYLFLMSKSQKYFYDAEAIKEPVNGTAHRRGKIKTPDGWDTGPGGHGSYHREGREKGKTRGVTPKSTPAGSGIKANESFHAATWDLVETRNRRSVWTIPTHPFPEAHFATFPPDLVKPCILAGSRQGDVVLDPFGGSGTVGAVARNLGRDYVLIELSPAYMEMAEARIKRETAQLNAFTGVRP
jgi:DNA modification methylase